jgi:hypothetical protein
MTFRRYLLRFERRTLLAIKALVAIKIAVVRDPFGNALGIIENPHFQIKRRSD